MAKKSQKPKPKRRYTPRQTRKFQLRQDNTGDLHIAEILDYARTQRREVTMIRDGVRLLWALENNNLSVLFDLFPHLQKQFVPEGTDLIDQLRQMLAEVRPVESPAPALKSLQPMAAARPLSLPLEDDDEDQDTIVLNRAKVDTGKNLLGSFASFS